MEKIVFSNKIIAVPIPGGKPLKLQNFLLTEKLCAPFQCFSMILGNPANHRKSRIRRNSDPEGSGSAKHDFVQLSYTELYPTWEG